MLVTDATRPDLLQERTDRRPGATACTYIDDERGPLWFAEPRTWPRVPWRARIVAEERGPRGLDGVVADGLPPALSK